MIKIGKTVPDISFYSCQPKTKAELIDIIDERIKQEGVNCDLNDIDVSKIEDMSWVFSNYISNYKFNGDISRWNVSNVSTMRSMFVHSDFNGDISDWDVGNIEDMFCIFYKSKFNHDISRWKINKDCNTKYIFDDCSIKEEYKPKILQQ